MNLSKRNVLKTFTILCLAASVLMGYQYLGAELYTRAEIWITDQEAGALRWLSWLFHSPWTDMLVQYVFVLGVPITRRHTVRLSMFSSEQEQ